MSKDSVVTIGVFDGLHIGHKAVIKKTVKRAGITGLASAVVTFDPHPLRVLSRKHDVPSLISLKHRIKLIKALGIDRVLVIKFDKKMAATPAETFIRNIVIGRAGAKEIFVGEDFRFGKGAGSDAEDLRVIGKRTGIGVHVIRHVRKGGGVVSSSRIRRLVTAGRVKEASLLLGRPYSILGTVVGGSRLGRLLGYPTANINPHHEAVPPGGVYAVRVASGGRLYKGIMNIGLRPTFYDHHRDMEPSIEAHIFNFKKRIYGRDLEIIFVKKLRNEKKFNKIDSLIEQIKTDEGKAIRILR